MKQYLLYTILLISLKTLGQSTYNSTEFTVVRSDIETNSYEKDSTANALVIFESGNTYIDKNSFNLKSEVKRKLKILNRNGFEKATVTILLYNSDNKKEKISDIHASTYNIENDKITQTQLDKEGIFEEKYNDKYTLIKFTLPNIKEGSVINYSYTLESPFIYKFRSWEFQDDIPKLYSEYNTSIPGNYEYNIKLVGQQKLVSLDADIVKNCLSTFSGAYAHCTVTKYIMQDIPAFRIEEFMTTKENYLSRIEYELKVWRSFDGRVDNITKTWKDADKELKTHKNVGRQLGKSTNLNGLLAGVLTDKSNALTKAKDIYKFVQDTYAWNEDYKLFSDEEVKDLIKEKSGNVIQINLLLHNLLEENGIDVKPVLLSTRNNGFATKLYPVISEFNYLIVQATIDGETYLLDATDDYLGFGQLPFRCLNQYGRLLDFKNRSEWIDIDIDQTSSKLYSVDLKLSKENNTVGTIKTRYTGYHALSKKQVYFENPNAYIENLSDTQTSINILNHEVETKEKNEEEFVEILDIELIDSNTAGDKLYINPFIYKFFKENPFKLQERSYPIDFGYKSAYLYSLQLDLGDAYEVVEMPKEVSGKLPNNAGDIILSTNLNDNKLTLFFKVSFKETIYSAGYYEVLKIYVNKILDIQSNSLIVLKRK